TPAACRFARWCRCSSGCGSRRRCSARWAPTWATAATCSSTAWRSKPNDGCSRRRRASTSATSTTPDGTLGSRPRSATPSGPPGDLTWSVLGLSTNVVSIVLMAGLLASLHWVLVVLALASAVLSLALERRITLKMYDMFYKETPDEREREYLGDLLVQPRTT